MEETKAGDWSEKSSAPEPKTERERKIRKSHEHAYTLEEVAEMLDKLPGPACTVIAVAAFTGLTGSELRGVTGQTTTEFNGAWFGWHAVRRGLGTRLNKMGVDDQKIQSILRHADISTTQAYYILPNLDRAKAGLKKLGAVAQKRYGIKA